MPVVQVRGERSLEPNHVYIVPSAHDVVIEPGVLKVLPSAVLLDIGLPLMDGYQVARQIRQQPGFENVVIVGLSGYTHGEAQRRSVEAGFDELLGKPFDLNVLGAKLARLVVGEN
jgi:CheY-like chemotaxis protein